MKKFITSVILSAIVLSAGAQSNIIKLNASALSLGNLSLQYERSLSTHTSVALGFSVLPSRTLPTFGATTTSTDYDINNISISGWSVTPEFRYYFSNKGPKGFYAAPYFRYSSYSLDQFVVKYAPVTGADKTSSAVISGDLKNMLLGVMFGTQWTLGTHFTLDWWIIGAAAGSQKATATGTGIFTPDNQADIQKSVKEVDIPGVDLTADVTQSQVTINYSSTLPAFRGFGLCIGYRF